MAEFAKREALLPDVDPGGLLEFSVVYTDRSLNHMSQNFGNVMRELRDILKEAYSANSVAIVPGSGTFAMEAVARQFATNEKVLIIRNGWFSFRWTQIIEMGRITDNAYVMKATQVADTAQSPFSPPSIQQVVEHILKEKPTVVFAPHVETSCGMMLPVDYLKAVGDAVRSVNGLFVLDCIASGTMWVNMIECKVDVLVTAPQKGWSGSPCAGFVCMSSRARDRVDNTNSSSFAIDLRKWLTVMETYEQGGHMYHATMPTDTLRKVCDMMRETRACGFEAIKRQQTELGLKVRALLESKGYKSVAAEGFQALSVVVSYTDDADIQNGKKFLNIGIQIAAGVPLMCDERADFRTWRLGLFGLEKLGNGERVLRQLEDGLRQLSRL